MSPTETISRNFSNYIPFKTDNNIIKSSWKNTLWNRKQVRILIGSSGELSIQTVAQNSFARIASALIKFISCGSYKSFGKKVVSFTSAGHLLPSDLEVPLSATKQQDVLNIQCGKLALVFLPSYKLLSDLGSQLCDSAEGYLHEEAVREKLVNMHQEILDFQLLLSGQLQEDISPEEMYKKFQAFEMKAKEKCEQYPQILKAFIEEHNQIKARASIEQEELAKAQILLEEQAKVQTLLKEQELAKVQATLKEQELAQALQEEQAKVQTLLEEQQAAKTQTTLKEQELAQALQEEQAKVRTLLEEQEQAQVLREEQKTLSTNLLEEITPQANTDIFLLANASNAIEIRNNPISVEVSKPTSTSSQSNETQETTPLTSAQKYSHILNATKDHMIDLRERLQFIAADWLDQEIKKIEKKTTNSIEKNKFDLAIEALENASDNTIENTSYAAQLLALPKNSPYEQKLKDQVILQIEQQGNQFLETLKRKKEEIEELTKNSTKTEWHQTLANLIEKAQSAIKTIAKSRDAFESSIPGLQTAKSLINHWLENKNPRLSLKTLDRYSLVKHLALIEKSCLEILNNLEKETQLESIQKLRSEYEQINSRVASKLIQLDLDGQFLYLSQLENIKAEHDKLLHKASSTLIQSKKALEYKQLLENALEVINNQLDVIKDNEIDPIEQLLNLKKLSSPYYASLHCRLLDKTTTLLKDYLNELKKNETIVLSTISHLKDEKSEISKQIQSEERKIKLAKMTDLETNIKAQIKEAQALTINYAARLHAWQIFNSAIPLKELPPHALKNYVNHVTNFVQNGSTQINEAVENIH